MGLNVAMPGSCLMANAAPAINPIQEQARQKFAGVPAGPSLHGGREAGVGPVIQRFGKFWRLR